VWADARDPQRPFLQTPVHPPDSKQRPAVACIYGDKSVCSLVVVDAVGNKIHLEYANGTITIVDANNRQLLHPESAAC
jgi:hypothetical protein